MSDNCKREWCSACSDEWMPYDLHKLNPAAPFAQRDFMTDEQVACELNVVVERVIAWRRKGQRNLPWVKIGHTVLYHRLDFIRWMRDNYGCSHLHGGAA